MKKLSATHQLLIGVALFCMFFGAGNLIFPPFLGYQAGQASLPAFLGFIISAVGLPILGVVAVSRTDGLENLAGRAGKPFAAVFTMLIYLSIGPCLAIPRTASTSFEMAVTPFLPEGTSIVWLRIAYSVVFFAIALALSLRPTKLVDLLGKRLAPVLLVLIGILAVGGLIHGFSGSNMPAEAYVSVPAVQGFLDGYQTMDAIAALIFGIILTANIRSRGITEKSSVVRTALLAGGVAAVLFVLVYGALTWIGAAGAAESGAQNGAQVLTYVANTLFGRTGLIILAAIFVVACLNTCISLICCCGQYFHRLFPKLPYAAWAVVFAAVSAIIANVGLNAILKISVPILGCLYPIAILLIGLAFLPESFHKTRPLLYPLSVALTGCVSVVSSLKDAGLTIPGVTDLIAQLPLFGYGLGWLLPALLGVAVGALVQFKSHADASR